MLTRHYLIQGSLGSIPPSPGLRADFTTPVPPQSSTPPTPPDSHTPCPSPLAWTAPSWHSASVSVYMISHDSTNPCACSRDKSPAFPGREEKNDFVEGGTWSPALALAHITGLSALMDLAKNKRKKGPMTGRWMNPAVPLTPTPSAPITDRCVSGSRAPFFEEQRCSNARHGSETRIPDTSIPPFPNGERERTRKRGWAGEYKWAEEHKWIQVAGPVGMPLRSLISHTHWLPHALASFTFMAEHNNRLRVALREGQLYQRVKINPTQTRAPTHVTARTETGRECIVEINPTRAPTHVTAGTETGRECIVEINPTQQQHRHM